MVVWYKPDIFDMMSLRRGEFRHFLRRQALRREVIGRIGRETEKAVAKAFLGLGRKEDHDGLQEERKT